MRRVFAPMVACALLVACGGLSSEVRRQAEQLETMLADLASDLTTREARLTAMLAQDEGAFLRPYAERENWADRFAAARKEIDAARAVFDREAAPRLAENDGEQEVTLAQVLGRLRADLRRAQALAAEPGLRAERLTDVRERGDEIVALAAARLGATSTASESAAARAREVARDYPAKAEDLTGRVAAIEKRRDDGVRALATARDQLARLASGDADLAVLADSTATVEEEVGQADTALADLADRFDQLYRSYSKTLVDMKEEYIAVIGRTSWNEFHDFPAEHEYLYRRPIDAEAAKALESLGEATIATGGSVLIDSAVWSALALNPNEQLPRGDNAAEFWISDVETTYFHRYLVVEGDRKTEGDWQAVEEPLFEAHYEDLGMDILAKPYGYYEDEVLAVAAPPGMAYVGDTRYGKWEEEPGGRRRWAWGNDFLFYYLLFGGGRRHHYYYNDWNGWRGGYRGRRPYYGPSGSDARYGTRGSVTKSSSRYAGSSFGKSGGFRQPDRTFRGAGPAGRGGGAGGRGK